MASVCYSYVTYASKWWPRTIDLRIDVACGWQCDNYLTLNDCFLVITTAMFKFLHLAISKITSNDNINYETHAKPLNGIDTAFFAQIAFADLNASKTSH